MDEMDITIIGAGVVGLAIGAMLAKNNREVTVLEKNVMFGQETSSRNSEVMHSGIHYRPGSLKAKFCSRGNELLYDICEKNSINYSRIGKLTVAINDDEQKILLELLDMGIKNGVKGLKVLDKKEANEIEPGVNAVGALYSPNTGIIDSHNLMKYYESEINHNNGIVVYDSEVVEIKKENDRYLIKIKKDDYAFKSRVVINSAGLGAHEIAAMAGIDINKAGYRIQFCKGEYFALSKKLPIKHLIYSVPKELGLGIHVVIDLGGNYKLGPNAFFVDKIDYKVDPSHIDEFYESAKKYYSDVAQSDLHPDMSGIRPKLKYEKNGYRDFIIRDEKDKGFPNFINLIGIESPGLTSAPAIAEYVKSILDKRII
ncbi:MAG: NAD(P)/FAD-dependent oxidoreductase [Elusimicrobiota bacterium]